jgi:hypothetical protein
MEALDPRIRSPAAVPGSLPWFDASLHQPGRPRMP